jgi:hypothetical protein
MISVSWCRIRKKNAPRRVSNRPAQALSVQVAAVA